MSANVLFAIWQPGSFLVLGEELTATVENMAEVRILSLYFSVVTITTLGYGDIVPQSIAARMFASGEAMVGQLYLAVFVARLVGLYTGYELRKDH